MKKALLFLFPTLMACGYQAMGVPQVASTPAEEPMQTSTAVTTGNNDHVSWQCRQADFNPNLIWIECQFHNISDKPAEACIQVVISDVRHVQVDQSRVTCSNMMAPGAIYENNVAFENTKKSQRRSRIAEKCSLDTSWCTISTTETKRDL